MQQKILKTIITVYRESEVLPAAAQLLIDEARAALDTAYAPYSGFRVGAALRLVDGQIIRGSNQENAAYPMCICAERAALAAAAARFPGVAVEAIAITYRQASPSAAMTAVPAAPCGACRQSLCETEDRHHHPIELWLQGQQGPVYSLASSRELLPLAFSGDWLASKGNK